MKLTKIIEYIQINDMGPKFVFAPLKTLFFISEKSSIYHMAHLIIHILNIKILSKHIL
jgi:hypothetical protein